MKSIQKLNFVSPETECQEYFANFLDFFIFSLHITLKRDIIRILVWRCILEYMTTKEAADKWGVKIRQVQLLCEKGQVENAKRLGNMWIMPVGTKKPIDRRTKEARQKV